MNWTDLTTYERKALIELLTGHHKVRARVPEDQSLLDKGLLLEDLDLGVHLSELGFNLAAEYIVIPATPAPTELERLQAENERLKAWRLLALTFAQRQYRISVSNRECHIPLLDWDLFRDTAQELVKQETAEARKALEVKNDG